MTDNQKIEAFVKYLEQKYKGPIELRALCYITKMLAGQAEWAKKGVQLKVVKRMAGTCLAEAVGVIETLDLELKDE